MAKPGHLHLTFPDIPGQGRVPEPLGDTGWPEGNRAEGKSQERGRGRRRWGKVWREAERKGGNAGHQTHSPEVMCPNPFVL